MTERITTSNGYEIDRPAEKLDAETCRDYFASKGIDGESPEERLGQIKSLTPARLAVFMDSLNRGLQGSKGSLVNKESAMKIGETVTIAPEYRYDVFVDLVSEIQAADEAINPARVADALALGIVMLHPFSDGNGRTARVVGLLLHDEYDNPDDYEEAFNVLAKSRDESREEGGVTIYGYTPHLPEGADQSDPEQVSAYLRGLLHDESDWPYIGPFGPAKLVK